MKSKDNLLKGIIIGIGVIIVPLILMGTTNNTIENKSKYELRVQKLGGPNIHMRGFLVNTETGETWFLVNNKKTKSKEVDEINNLKMKN